MESDGRDRNGVDDGKREAVLGSGRCATASVSQSQSLLPGVAPSPGFVVELAQALCLAPRFPSDTTCFVSRPCTSHEARQFYPRSLQSHHVHPAALAPTSLAPLLLTQ